MKSYYLELNIDEIVNFLNELTKKEQETIL